MTTLFDAILGVGRVLGGLSVGVATGGSTTTIIDTVNRVEENDYWNAGTALIVKDAGDASAAPEGQIRAISDFVQSSATVTTAAFSAAVAAGDVYALIPPRFSLDKIRNAINAVLVATVVPAIDTTLTTVANQTEYELPDGISAHTIRQVFYQTNNDTDNNKWVELRNWQVLYTDTGDQDILIIPEITPGYTILVSYVVPHSALQDASEEIHKAIHVDRIVWRAAEIIMSLELSWQDNYKNSANMANYYASKAQDAEMRHPIVLPPRNGIIVDYSVLDSSYTGEVGKVRL